MSAIGGEAEVVLRALASIVENVTIHDCDAGVDLLDHLLRITGLATNKALGRSLTQSRLSAKPKCLPTHAR
jgi:hypothetical protein